MQELDRGGADALLLMVDTARALLTGIERDGVEPDVDVLPAVEALLGSIHDRPPVMLAARDEPPGSAAVPAAVDERPEGGPVPAPGAAGHGAGVGGPADSTIRVGVHHLDGLMRLVGEVLEAVKDPLTHLVRNAVGHGIEPPAQRIAAGKPAHGRLILRARHEHSRVVVEVSDDGAGIDPERIGRIAVQLGLLGQRQLDAMDPADVQRLVLRAGFSTADRVSTVSGRGVGMDVVLANLEGVGGTVELASVPGEGTTWRLTIPLTLAIVPALIVESGGQRFVVPQPAVHELVFLDPPSGQSIEHLLGAAVYRLRGRLLPVVRLSAVLGQGCADNGGQPPGGYLVVLTADGRRFGLVVDRVLSTEEVVVKPLAARFKHLGCYSGAAILGDGRVALILDALALARRSGLTHADWPAGGELVTAARAAGHPRLLVTGVAGRRVAIPLSAVTRLEEFAVSSVERVGRREVVQYRGRLLPLVRLRRLLGAPDGGPAGQLPAVVISAGRRGVALAVDAILDIVDGPDGLGESADGATGPNGTGFADGPVDDGLAGAAAVQRAVTELLDVRHAILAADPRFFDEPAPGELDWARP